MNFIAIIILITLLSDFIINITADILNLKMVKSEIPKSFNKIYDKERYKLSQNYLKTNTKFEWLISVFDFILLIIFWFCKGFYFLDIWIRSFNYQPIINGILFLGILMLIKAVFLLPFTLYHTFVIEERFGFNKTDIKTFVLDRIKAIILSILLGIPILACILAFFEYTGKNAWLYCFIALTLIMFFLQFIIPTWIMPIFNKFKPLEDSELKSAIMNYAKSIKFPLKNVFIMDGSKRSTKSNAFFTGFGKNKRIVLFDTLVEKHSLAELISIIAHEMGHFKKKHILKSMIIGIFQFGFLLYLMSFFLSYDELFKAFYIDKPSVYAGLTFFSMLYTPIDFFINIFFNMYSRKNEYDADDFAVKTTNDNKSLVYALKKLSVDNLSNLLPHPLYVFLNYSHPPVLDRIKNITNNKVKK